MVRVAAYTISPALRLARAIGTVACVQGELALAVVSIDAPVEGLSAGGIALASAPLLGGLAR